MTLFEWNVLAGMWFFFATQANMKPFPAGVSAVNFYLFSALALVALLRTWRLLP